MRTSTDNNKMSDARQTIDSSAMTILTDFPVEYDDAEIESPGSTNIKECFVKTDGDWIVLATNSRGANEPIGNVAFEASTAALLSEELKAVLSGKLREEEADAATVKNGADTIIISATSNLPINQTSWVNRVSISNLREIELDEIEFGELSLPVRAARRLSEELERLITAKKI